MKHLIFLQVFILTLTACNNRTADYNQIQQDLASARDSITILQKRIDELSYPADHRLDNITRLFKNGDLDSATVEINRLTSLFPQSEEARQAADIATKIAEIRKAKAEEEKRLKALGFKAAKESTSVSFGEIKAVFSSFKTANTYTFDHYDTRYFYRQADKGHKFISAAMSITSNATNPLLPQCAVYFVDGDMLTYSGITFNTHFARWDDYGAYLGNYADYNNDFSKVNTVKFKIGAQIAEEDLKRPFAIVLKKEGALSRKHEAFSCPEISYSGGAEFTSTLTLSDIGESGMYVIIKKYNFDKL